MRGLNSNDIRSGRQACSLILITSLLILFHCQFYMRVYTASAETYKMQMIELTKKIISTELINIIFDVSEIRIENEKATILEAKRNAENVVEKTEYEIPKSFVNPITGNTVSYKGGKTLERTSKITYGEAGKINRMASPDQDGFMKIDNRYLIAVGSRFETELGQYMDLVLENGVVIPCVMGDLKADRDTDKTNTFTYHSRCCSEFIIDEHSIRSDIYKQGNASLKTILWDSPVVSVVVYDEYYKEA